MTTTTSLVARFQLTSVALAILFAAGCSDAAATSGDPDAAVGEELVDMYDDTRNFIDLTRTELIAELEERQAEFADIERDLDARAESLEAGARQAWDERRKEVERLRSELATGILELKTASEDSWEKLREELVVVTRELRRELAAAALLEAK